MLRDIIRKEIMDNISTMKFVVTFAVVVVLVISGLMIGTKDYLEKRNDARMQPQRNQESIAAQSSWLVAGYIGVFDAKRPYVLSIIDHGIENSLGRSAQVSLGLDATLDESRNLLSPILAVFGEVDLTFVVKTILSLFVILLTFDAISGEKERGTLKLTLSNSVGRSTFILGKMIGGFAVIGLSFILPLVLGMAFMMGFYPDVLAEFTGETWLRLLIIVCVYLLYLALFFAVGMFVSALSQRSSTAFIVLLMVWVLFVTIIPRLSLSAAERIRPYESYSSLQTKANKEIASQRGELMKKFQDQAAWGQAIQKGEIAAMFASIFEDQAKQQQQIMQKYDEEFLRQQEAQISFAEMSARSLSPTSALTFAVQNLSGTGYDRQREYTRQLREFQGHWRTYVLQKMKDTKITNPADIMSKLFMLERLDVSLKDVTFNYQEESFGTVLGRALLDIGVLAIMTLLFFAAAYVAFMRYDVR